MRAFRYYLVIASVALTLWSAARAKAFISATDKDFFDAPPPMHWLSNADGIHDKTRECTIERELESIEW